VQAELSALRREAEAAAANSASPSDLDALERAYLGRRGKLTLLLAKLPGLNLEEKRRVGPLANEVKRAIARAVDARRRQLAERIDLDPTLPPAPSPLGHLHPLTQALRDIEDIFLGMGFEVVEGTEVEEEKFNFDLLNIPKNHPARDLHDTFWLTVPGLLLRTHTSPMQVRAARTRKPPIRLIVPGRVFRHEATDAGHEAQFYQCEGLVVDEHVRVSDLIGTLQAFVSSFFGEQLTVRLRPHYYPFVEPGFDVDMTCTVCHGNGCAVCKRTGWIETLGSGMVHPAVLRTMGVDPKRFSGFAFGLGVDRLVQVRAGVSDIRLSYAADLRFLEQF
jgi:phenylalanyl-tRNA synthetase alpha chain